MQILKRDEYPDDLLYFRKFSYEYGKYLEMLGMQVIASDTACDPIWSKKLFGNALVVFNSERAYVEPNISELKKKSHAKHGAVVWVPCKSIKKPK